MSLRCFFSCSSKHDKQNLLLNWVWVCFQINLIWVKKVLGNPSELIEVLLSCLNPAFVWLYCPKREHNITMFLLHFTKDRSWSGSVPWAFVTVTNNHIVCIFTSFSWHVKGAHVTITARSSEDVEESVVLEKVKKASGSNKTIMCGCHQS